MTIGASGVDAFVGFGNKEIKTMTIGAKGVNAFVGLNGPYWVDSTSGPKANGLIDRDTNGNIIAAETNSRATGLVIDNLDFGLLLGKPTNPIDPVRYAALKASVNSFGLVNMPGGVTATGAFDVAFNVGSTATTAVNFVSSFPATANPVAPAGYLVKTGDPSSTVLLNFTGPQSDIKLTGALGVASLFNLIGTFFFDISPGSLKIFANAILSIGPSSTFFDLHALGVLVIKSSGVAADIDLQLKASALGLNTAVNARVILNTTGAAQSVAIPQKYLGSLDSITLSRLTPAAVDGSRSYTVPADAPDINGVSFAAPGTYLVVRFSATIEIMGNSFVGDFRLTATSSHFTLSANATLAFGVFNYTVVGNFSITTAGVAETINLGAAAIPSSVGITLNVTNELQINTATALFRIHSQGALSGPGFSLNGDFDFTATAASLSVQMTNAVLSIGPVGDFFGLKASGVLTISSAGVVADLSVTMTVGAALSDLALLNVSSRAILNTTGAQPIVVVNFSATLRVLTFDFVGNFELRATPSQFQITADATLNLGIGSPGICLQRGHHRWSGRLVYPWWCQHVFGLHHQVG